MTDYREKLTRLWHTRISEIYDSGQIATERALQAMLFRELDGNGKDPTCWIEPTLWVQTTDRSHPTIKPDIVVTEGEEIKCIIELKYFPNKQVRLSHDFKKLKDLQDPDLQKKEGYLLQIDPKTGKYDPERFKIVDDTLFVMACIARNDWWEVNDQDKTLMINDNKINNFLILLATINGQDFNFQI